MTAERLIDVLLAENYKLITFGKPVRMIRRASAFHTDRMNLLHILGYGHEGRHRAERLAHVVGIKTCYDHSYTSVRKSLHDLDNSVVEELCLIDSYYLHIA